MVRLHFHCNILWLFFFLYVKCFFKCLYIAINYPIASPFGIWYFLCFSVDCLYTPTSHLHHTFDACVIQPGQSVDVPFTFYPREPIKYKETVTFEINGLSKQNIEISGQGTEMKVCSISWENLSLGVWDQLRIKPASSNSKTCQRLGFLFITPIAVILWAMSWENYLCPNKKGADQPAHLRSLISAFVVHCLDSIISLVSISEISSL